jgi:PAS domain S-box-containing protein
MKKRTSGARAGTEALWEWNLASNRIHFSPRWIALVGCDEHDVGNAPEEWLNRVHPDERPGVLADIDAARDGQRDEIDLRHRLRHKNGSYLWTACRVSVVRNNNGANVRLMGVHTDITVETVADKLTGLPNRLLLIDRLTQSIERTQKYEGFHYAVLLLELGGRPPAPLLISAARRLETSLRIANGTPTMRSDDVVARIDGDQFAVLLNGLKAVSHAKVVADRLLNEMLEPFTIDGREVFISVSVGVAVSATGYTQAEDVLRDAGIALHRAQVLGGRHCEVFDTVVLQSREAELQLEADLNDALERREFHLLYQPIVSMASSTVVGFEALVRWHHPVLGVISPVDFIPIAERTGAIVELGDWILREACIRCKAWHDTASASADLWMSVNLSGVQLKDATLAERVAAALRDSGLHARHLVLELTESMAMENPAAVKGLLMQLRSTGVRISIDDFGTGYSSLAHLRQLPVDALKIDRSFVRGIETRTDAAAIVKTLTEMALGLGLHVVAEGIENEQQLELLRSLHCHSAQGYLFAKPLDEAAAAATLTSGIARPSTARRDAEPPPRLAGIPRWGWATAAVVVLFAAGLLSLPQDAERLPVVTSPPSLATVATAESTLPSSPIVNVPTSVVVVPNTRRDVTNTLDTRTDKKATEEPRNPDTPKHEPDTPANDVQSLSLHVIHYHRLGHCEGHLIASRAGLAYVPDTQANDDAFEFGYNQFVHVLQDDTLTIKSSTRTYRFKPIVEKGEKPPSLSDFEARLAHWR